MDYIIHFSSVCCLLDFLGISVASSAYATFSIGCIKTLLAEFPVQLKC